MFRNRDSTPLTMADVTTTENSLSIVDLRHLKSLDSYFMSDCYWEEETIRRFRALGLVSRDGKRIVLTDAGRLAPHTTDRSQSSYVVKYRKRAQLALKNAETALDDQTKRALLNQVELWDRMARYESRLRFSSRESHR